ncbi:hypothetical protein PUNSTDRAFT_135335 [Punctularia strigosozonata HHB-11173 SS5]|uniref:uncharacterized protein n=1 Tax=Punctularia strigosozonata (strain HHB-11173) TaxID=741275 RepID=UPI000441635F|nr:uncharacterized protein PUNSTDRAFT_135335 [Punctularia strigosozonata HHB-11173 SS5]EIN07819.1 hypothetical protein PUNSTDRAFT_135335 [Punctularia strigosozonata HHB-11173 SS5]
MLAPVPSPALRSSPHEAVVVTVDLPTVDQLMESWLDMKHCSENEPGLDLKRRQNAPVVQDQRLTLAWKSDTDFELALDDLFPQDFAFFIDAPGFSAQRLHNNHEHQSKDTLHGRPRTDLSFAVLPPSTLSYSSLSARPLSEVEPFGYASTHKPKKTHRVGLLNPRRSHVVTPGTSSIAQLDLRSQELAPGSGNAKPLLAPGSTVNHFCSGGSNPPQRPGPPLNPDSGIAVQEPDGLRRSGRFKKQALSPETYTNRRKRKLDDDYLPTSDLDDDDYAAKPSKKKACVKKSKVKQTVSQRSKPFYCAKCGVGFHRAYDFHVRHLISVKHAGNRDGTVTHFNKGYCERTAPNV